MISLLLLSWALGADVAEDPADGLKQYMAHRLVVEQRHVTTVYAKDYDGSGSFWFASEGGRDLSAVRFAEAVGDETASRQLRRRRGRATALGVLGVAMGFVGPVSGVLVARTPAARDSMALRMGSLGLLGAGVVGLVGGTVTLSRQVRLGHPSVLYTESEAEELARARNAELRIQYLGE